MSGVASVLVRATSRVNALVIGLMLGAVSIPVLAADTPISVEIRGEPGHYQLFRGGEPYHIRGAGVGADDPNVDDMLASLAARGGNSVRTWHVDGAYLDAAHALGLSVALCLDVARERHGFDYSDARAVRRQLETMREQVLAHRNHPALLAWVIGNELNHDYSDPRVYDAVNDLSKMIHALDPHHPTTTTTAGLDVELARVIEERAPDLDFVSVQLYGGLFDLPDVLARAAMNKPVMVTEWGTIGHWEVPVTSWGAPIELDSSRKAAMYRKSYQEVIAPLTGQMIGNYAFLWGQKQERTSTWYGVWVDGLRTEAVDVLQTIWTGEAIQQPAPAIDAMYLDRARADESVRLRAGRHYPARVLARSDAPLLYRWEMREESRATQTGGDAEDVPPHSEGMVVARSDGRAHVVAPKQPGPYRLFVYVLDGRGAIAHANIPFFVDE